MKLGHPNSAQYGDSYIDALQVDDHGRELVCWTGKTQHFMLAFAGYRSLKSSTLSGHMSHLGKNGHMAYGSIR